MTELEVLKLHIDYLEAENMRLRLRIENMMWWNINKDNTIHITTEKEDVESRPEKISAGTI